MTYNNEPLTMNLKQLCLKSKSSSKLHRKKRKKLQQLLEQKTANVPTPPSNTRRFKRRIDSSAATDNLTARGKVEENKLVINLSNIPVAEAQERLLTLGPKLCLTPRSINTHQLSEDVREGCRRVRLQEWHHTSDTDDSADEDVASTPKVHKPRLLVSCHQLAVTELSMHIATSFRAEQAPTVPQSSNTTT